MEETKAKLRQLKGDLREFEGIWKNKSRKEVTEEDLKKWSEAETAAVEIEELIWKIELREEQKEDQRRYEKERKEKKEREERALKAEERREREEWLASEWRRKYFWMIDEEKGGCGGCGGGEDWECASCDWFENRRWGGLPREYEVVWWEEGIEMRGWYKEGEGVTKY